jgi:GNAT superfamily N-acetyltransferase
MYKFLKIEPELYIHIQTLYRICFHYEVDLKEIALKYDTSLFGCSDIGFLAFDQNDKPAAYYGVFPMILKYNNEQILVAQSGDTMTAPQHQKKGLFVQLARKTYEYAKKVGIQFVFGFPNENSFPGFEKKLSWIFFGNMERFDILNRTLPLCEISSKSILFESIYYQWVKYRLKNYLIKSMPTTAQNFDVNPAGIERNLNFFKYKLKVKNVYLITIASFEIMIKIKGHLIIGDVAYFNKSEFSDFISIVKALGHDLGCRKVVFTMNKNHWLHEYFNEFFVSKTSLPIGFLFLNDQNINPEKISFIHSDFDTF